MAIAVRHCFDFVESHYLVSHGSIDLKTGEPLVACYFRPLDLNSSRKPPITKQIPMAQALDLRPGDVIGKNGELGAYPGSNIYSTNLNLSLGSPLSATRADIAELGMFPALRLAEHEDGGPTSDTRWLVLASTDPAVNLVAIPDFVVFADYLAPDSRLAEAYLSGEILSIIRSLEQDQRNVRDDAGVCTLFLPRPRLRADAAPLARIQFDQTGFAKQTAINVVNKLMLAVRNDRPFSISCGFPFQGKTRLTYRGFPFANKRGQIVHFVLSIERCTFPLPYSKLDVHLDQPSSNAISGSSNSGIGNGGRPPNDFDDEFVELDPDGPRPVHGPALIATGRRPVVFDNPGDDAVTITRRDVERDSRNSSKGPKRKRSRHSAHKGSASGDRKSQETTIATDPSGNRDSNDKKNSCHLSPVDAINSVLEALTTLSNEDGVHHRCLHVTQKTVMYRGFALCEMPNSSHGRQNRWTHIRNGAQRRCVLAAEIVQTDKYLYLFEILRNPAECFSTLVFYRADGSQIAESELGPLVTHINMHEGLPDDTTIGNTVRATVERTRHPSTGATSASGESLRRTIKGRIRELRKASAAPL